MTPKTKKKEVQIFWRKKISKKKGSNFRKNNKHTTFKTLSLNIDLLTLLIHGVTMLFKLLYLFFLLLDNDLDNENPSCTTVGIYSCFQQYLLLTKGQRRKRTHKLSSIRQNNQCRRDYTNRREKKWNSERECWEKGIQ